MKLSTINSRAKKYLGGLSAAIGFGLICMMLSFQHPSHAQGPATPIPVNPPTGTASPLPPTDIPTPTPTSLGPASARALNDGSNVRAQADITSERLGQLFSGQTAPIRGRFFEWIQIEFPDSPTGLGWVHQSVVEIEGDSRLIIDLSLDGIPTDPPEILSVGETLAAITSTPGIMQTLTAEAENAASGNPLTLQPQPGAPLGDAPNAPNESDRLALPTFTPPMITLTPLNLADYTGQRENGMSTGGLPPIAPIGAFIGLGLAGLLIVALRRL